MAKLPTSENTEIFIMRMTPALKQKLNQLAKKSKYGGNASSTVRVLIESAYREY